MVVELTVTRVNCIQHPCKG